MLTPAAEVFAQGGANVQVHRARIGYLDELDAGWLPVSFSLENLGTETPIQLVATVRAGGSTVWTSERTVVLPPKSRRVEALYLKITEGAQTIDVQVVADGRPIHASNRGVNWRATPWRAPRREPPVPLHALVVREGPQDRALQAWLEPQGGSLTNPSSTAPAPVTLSAEQIEPRELPDRPEGYDGIDLVVLSKTSARAFDEPRRSALLAWLQNGGRVILLPGSDAGWFQDELVKQLLPQDVEVGRVETELRALSTQVGNAWWGGFTGNGRGAVPSAKLYTFRTARHGVRAGTEYAAGKRVPYFTLYKYGSGDVIVAAFDLETTPFSESPRATPELGRILHSIVEPIPDRRRIPDDERLAGWFDQALVEGELPSPLFLIPVVVVYVLCVGPLNQRLVRRASTPVLSVVTIPVISIVFTVVCFFAGYILRGSSTSLDRLAVIEAHPGDDLGREWAGLRIRSASSTNYAVAAAPNLVATQRSWNEADKQAGRVEVTRVNENEGRFEFPELPLNLWERAFFQARGPFHLGGAVTIEATPRSCTVKNGTKLALGPGVVFLPGTDGFRVPPIPAGGSATVDGSLVASIKDKAEVLAAICEGELQQKVATRSLESYLNTLKLETTYVATVRDLPEALSVVGRARPDRDLAVLVVQGDDQARDEEVYRWATSVARERSHEDYEDALRMLGAIPPTSRWARDAMSLRGFIATAKYVDAAQDAYDAGDLDKARSMVLEVLALPELDRDAVREIRSRLERWTVVAKQVEDGCAAANANLADRQFRAALEKEPSANAFHRLAQSRIDEMTQVRGLDWKTAHDRGTTAAIENEPGRALIALRYSERFREGRAVHAETLEAVAAAEQRYRWAARLEDDKGTAIQRAELSELAQLLREFLPVDDSRRDAAVRFLERRKGAK